jgi:hypothetical protein
VHAVQQHQHGNFDFNYDHSEQHELNNSQQLNLNQPEHIDNHGQRQFQFNRSFSNSVAAQRDVGNGSEPLHAGQ